MKLNRVIGFVMSFILIYSCSKPLQPISQKPTLSAPISAISDSLLLETSIDFSPFEVSASSCYKPNVQIRDSFTSLEKHRVGITDYAMFIQHTDLFINFEEIEDGTFHFPLMGARVLSKFGRRSGRQHKGIDLKINRRDTVTATFDGIVRIARWIQGYGNVIVIRHYNGLETVYAHNSKHFVHSGDRVKAGTPISLTGTTGRATTDHLHFEIRVNGIPINPQLIIDFENQTLLPKHLVFSLDKKGKLKIETV